MKKLIYNLLLSIILLFPIGVFAEGNISVSPSSLSIEVGSSKTFNISAYNTIGDVSISSSNPSVATVNINEYSTGMVEEKQTKTGTVTVTGNNVGTAVINLTIDAATFDGEDLSGQTRSVTVNVVAKPNPEPSTPSNNDNTNTNNINIGNNSASNTANVVSNDNNEDNKSTNTNLKELSVEGYKLVKVDNNNYTLSVNNTVTSITIKALTEDSKATVLGTGKHDINIGENNIELVVKSESGTEKKISIKVTRKEVYSIDDLEELLKDSKLNDLDISIDANTKITQEYLESIKNSKKTVRFNYSKDKKILYSWLIDGTKIKNTNEFSTEVLFKSDNKDDILELSNYAEGLYISFRHSGKIPEGVELKVYVGDKFKDNSIINIYGYKKENDSLETIKKSLKVKDGYVEFAINYAYDSLFTMANIGEEEAVGVTEKNKSIIPFIIIITLTLILIVLLLYIIKRKNKRKKIDDVINNSTNNSANTVSIDNNYTNEYNDVSDNYSYENYQDATPTIYNNVTQDYPNVEDYENIPEEQPIYIYDVTNNNNSTTDNQINNNQ